jgi:hypothetical protein
VVNLERHLLGCQACSIPSSGWKGKAGFRRQAALLALWHISGTWHSPLDSYSATGMELVGATMRHGAVKILGTSPARNRSFVEP